MKRSLCDVNRDILAILLMDRTTGKNIKWATDDYESLGDDYRAECPMTLMQVYGRNSSIVQPRIDKAAAEQDKRTRDRAEVFTPSWVCNEQNNLVDSAWFGRYGVFNVSEGNDWRVNMEPVQFTEGRTWQSYVLANRLEITCGEAPYLVSRYDTVSGEHISTDCRIGLLDRKLRVVNENVCDDEWFDWVVKAYQSVYGYEFQGDNLLLARLNLYHSFLEYYAARFSGEPTQEQCLTIAKVISWNLWQMDGITMLPPLELESQMLGQLSLFAEDTAMNDIKPCMIFDWDINRAIRFTDLIEGT